HHFAVSESQVMKDLDLLWVTGLPGYYPNDLIDFAFDEEEASVFLREAQGLSRPVPFAPREALALAAAVEWLRASGAAEGSAARALESVRHKLRGLVPAVLTGTPPVDVEMRRTVLRAAAGRRGIHIHYVSAGDEATERTVYPEALRTDGAHWYLDAWCTRASARRSFRMDRILTLAELGEGIDDGGGPDASGAPSAKPPGSGGGTGQSETEPEAEAFTTVRVRLLPRARWLAEEIPGARITSEDADSLVVELELGRWDWLVRVLLGLGDSVREVSPPELAAEVRSRARAALGAYGGHGAGEHNR
nr:WYL domain-containing protein [Actinomycetales bacterium]